MNESVKRPNRVVVCLSDEELDAVKKHVEETGYSASSIIQYAVKLWARNRNRENNHAPACKNAGGRGFLEQGDL